MLPSVEERRNALYSLAPTWEKMTLATHFSIYCHRYRERTLLITPMAQYTYEEVWLKAREVAKALMAIGVRPRDHVAVLMANEPELVFTLIGLSDRGWGCVR